MELLYKKGGQFIPLGSFRLRAFGVLGSNRAPGKCRFTWSWFRGCCRPLHIKLMPNFHFEGRTHMDWHRDTWISDWGLDIAMELLSFPWREGLTSSNLTWLETPESTAQHGCTSRVVDRHILGPELRDWPGIKRRHIATRSTLLFDKGMKWWDNNKGNIHPTKKTLDVCVFFQVKHHHLFERPF